MDLDDGLTALPGVGAKTAARARDTLGIESIRDLVEHYPRRYQDLGDVTSIDLALTGQPVTLVGEVTSWSYRRTGGRRGRSLDVSTASVIDRSGSGFTVTFFNQKWREQRLPPGTVAAFSGKLQEYRNAPQLAMPEVSVLGNADESLEDHQRLVPLYRATEAVPSWKLAGWIELALGELPPFADHLPERLLDGHDLVDLDLAMRQVHAPDDRPSADAARRRLKFDELFTLQVGLQWRRARLEADVVGKDNRPVSAGRADGLLAALPFEPTAAQERAMAEVGDDLGADRPMHRLLQGDVGSGKTLVAAWTMLCAVDQGRQAALMVPTEVLAEQHHRTLSDLLAPLGVNVLDGIRVEVLTSSSGVKERRRILGELLTGRVDIVVGTHALLEEGVRFADLGVVVIDEQHRFGVAQRVQLKEKGEEQGSAPDVLVMTATPIPRSLALTLYGDLDVSVLDELPPGRQPIVTQLITPAEFGRRERVYDFVVEQAKEGRQAYLVCPLVEESEAVAARSVEEVHEQLVADRPELRVELVHGRMRGDQKDAAMGSFRRGEADVLVATTVIEVGVDVPNASIMIIENAERFGISQLHQLRGRVGRGTIKSYCVLFAGWDSDLTEDAAKRLEAVAATTDGFELAEVDLEIRGEGQLFGQKQSGLPDLKIARLIPDRDLIAETRAVAQDLVASDPEVSDPSHAALRVEVLRRYRGGLEELDALETG